MLGPLEAQSASLPDNDEPANHVSTPGAWLLGPWTHL